MKQQPPWMVSDELRVRIEPLLPTVPRRADHPSRRRLDDRKVLCGILFVLHTGIPWEVLAPSRRRPGPAGRITGQLQFLVPAASVLRSGYSRARLETPTTSSATSSPPAACPPRRS